MKNIFLFILITFCYGCNTKSTTDSTVDIEALHQQNLKDSTLVTGWYYVVSDSDGFTRKLQKTDEVYVLNPRPIAVADNLSEIELGQDIYGHTYIKMQFDGQATEWWKVATKAAIGKSIAFILNDELLGVSYVNNEITNGANAFGRMDYSEDEYNEVISIIQQNKRKE